MRRSTFLLLFLTLAAPLAAEEGWTFQASLGAAANLETTLKIRQSGFADIEVNADYETRPFDPPLYYSLRVGRWSGRGGWEVELIHHKLILRNPPPEVRRFEISHGYNLITVNRGWDLGHFLLRAGAGAVLAHPEGALRGRPVNPGNDYHLTGPALQVGVEKRFRLGASGILGIEGKVSAARATMPIEAGEVEAPNIAGHLLLSLGVRGPRR
ncbi:MAG TPA: hypothetical protein VGG03_13905 [Thermoanaerobaculia bacterium]|jgi:hypothetical protein